MNHSVYIGGLRELINYVHPAEANAKHIIKKGYEDLERKNDQYFHGDMLMLSDLRGKTVLDIGSGMGDFVNELRSEGVNAIGLDPNDYEFNNIGHHVKGYAQQLPFVKEAFDFVY